MDHKHPAFMTDATQGVLSSAAQGSVDATADFLKLINGARGMTDKKFRQSVQDYENKWFKKQLSH